MFQDNVNHSQENAMNMAQVRANKPDRGLMYYKNDSFANEEQKTELANLRRGIRKILKNDYKIEESKRVYAIRIGKKALILKELLIEINKTKEPKIAITKYMAIHFDKDMKRINEYIAARLAYNKVKKTEKDKFSLTHLIVMGQKLGSKKKEYRISSVKSLKTNQLPDGTTLSDTKASHLPKILEEQLEKRNINYYFKNIEKNLLELSIRIHDLEKFLIKDSNKNGKLHRDIPENFAKLTKKAKTIIIKLDNAQPKIIDFIMPQPDPVKYKDVKHYPEENE